MASSAISKLIAVFTLAVSSLAASAQCNLDRQAHKPYSDSRPAALRAPLSTGPSSQDKTSRFSTQRRCEVILIESMFAVKDVAGDRKGSVERNDYSSMKSAR
jgi:hypothetical protein